MSYKNSHSKCNIVQGIGSQSVSNNEEMGVIFRIEKADWVLSCQLADQKLKQIHQVLIKPPIIANERQSVAMGSTYPKEFGNEL